MTAETLLIHPEIWQRAYPAIEASRVKAHNYLASGGWCLQHDVPTLTTNEYGWPWLSFDQFGENRPHRLSSLFGEKAPAAKHFSHADVPEIVDFYNYCRSRTDLIGTLLPPADFNLAPFEDMFIHRLLFGVMDRCEAVNAATEAQTLLVYAQAEKAIFQPSLPAELIVPVANGNFEFDKPWRIDSNVWIEPLDECTQRARATRHTVGVHMGVLNLATHAAVAGAVELNNSNPWTRTLGRATDVSPALAKVEHVFRSLRVLTSVPIGYAQVLLRPIGWADHWALDLPPLITVDEVRRYPDVLEDRFWLRAKRLIPQSKLEDLPLIFKALCPENPRLDLAARRLEMATMRPSVDDQVIDCTIGFEALLGGDKTEITHKLALRGAALLSEKLDVSAVYAAVRSIYNRRSEIVHGSNKHKYRTMKIKDAEVDAAEAAILLLQHIITAVAKRGGQLNPSDLDDHLLKALSRHATKGEGES